MARSSPKWLLSYNNECLKQGLWGWRPKPEKNKMKQWGLRGILFQVSVRLVQVS